MENAPLDELKIVNQITRRIDSGGPTRAIVGLGDDAAIIPAQSGPLVLTVDTVTEGQDFLWDWPSGVSTTLEDVGWKLAAQNLSDINAMAARPKFMVLSVTLADLRYGNQVTQLVDGIIAAANELGQPQVEIVGGDTGNGTEFSATLTVLGELDAEADPLSHTLLRSQAKPGDALYIAGSLGLAAAGLAILQDPRGELAQKYPTLVTAQIRPRPNLRSGEAAVKAGMRCGMDVSDGLLMDAKRIAEASSVRIDIDGEAVAAYAAPLREAAGEMGADAESWVLSGGEDYALLTAASPGLPVLEGFVRVGTVLDPAGENSPKVTLNGEVSSSRMGWDPFK